MDQAVEHIRSFLADRIREGFESAYDIVEDAMNDAREAYGRDDLLPAIKRLLAELLAAHRAEQDGWSSSTDCDRLDAAFSALNRQGIVARQHFSCCTRCGHTDIWDEIEVAERQQSVDGYVFYHLQCTQHAMETGQLLLAYGCVDEQEAALIRVADTIVAELRRVGLDVKWGGTDAYPIVVDGIVWRKRR